MEGSFGGNSHRGTPSFCKVYCIFNIYPFKKFDLSSSNGLKVQNLEDPIEEIPQPDTPDFSRTKVLPDMLNRSNFEYRALSGLKVDNKKKDAKTRKIVFKLGQTNITKGG